VLIHVHFWQSTEIKKIQKEQPLQQPPMPPQKRKWRGSTVAPFAGNNMLVLYRCPAPDRSISKHFVQVLHNEHPIPMPVSFCYLSFTNSYGPGVARFHLLFKILLSYWLSITRYVSSYTGLWWLWFLSIWTIQGTYIASLQYWIWIWSMCSSNYSMLFYILLFLMLSFLYRKK